MKKKILILSVLMLLSLTIASNPVSAQEANLAASIGTAELNIEQGPGDRVNFEGTDGFPGRINDENDDSYITATWDSSQAGEGWGYGPSGEGWGWGPGIIYEAIVTFSEPVNLNRVEYVREGNSGSGICVYNRGGIIMTRACVLNGTEETYLYYSGASDWESSPINTRPALGSKSTESILGSWENVEAVKVRVDINIWSYFPDDGRHYFYELRAFGITSPTVSTNDATDVQDISAVLNGNITSTGGENPNERGFEWGTVSGGPYLNSWTEPGSFGTGVFSRTIIGLSRETPYFFRAKARNSVGGWKYGSERSFTTTAPPPCGPHNVWGWAWSENIGWISFSCRNIMAEGAGIDYGVDIDEVTGVFSGGAWSSSIGWISFEPADLVGCPSGTCNASLGLIAGELSGWARALSYGDGWDGWIKLRGTVQSDGSPYGVSIISNPSPPPASVFEGWAWGGDDTVEEAVVGWISFNCSNTGSCPGIDYKVMTSITSNVPPEAAISCSPSCTVYDSEVLVLENNSTDPDSTNPEANNDIKESRWSIDGVLKDTCTSNPLCNFTPQNFVGIGSYTAELYVEDLAGEWDTMTKNFQIKRDISVAFSCSLDNILWENCEDIAPTEEEAVYLRDDSMASEGAVIDSRVWERDGSPFGGSNPNPGTSAVYPSMNIKLTVTDNADRSASVAHTIGAKIALPIWKEIHPF